MPAPAGAIVGLLPIYVHSAFDLGQPTRNSPWSGLYVLAVALMASRVPHFRQNHRSRATRGMSR
jgi:hypothetical protein